MRFDNETSSGSFLLDWQRNLRQPVFCIAFIPDAVDVALPVEVCHLVAILCGITVDRGIGLAQSVIGTLIGFLVLSVRIFAETAVRLCTFDVRIQSEVRCRSTQNQHTHIAVPFQCTLLAVDDVSSVVLITAGYFISLSARKICFFMIRNRENCQNTYSRS